MEQNNNHARITHEMHFRAPLRSQKTFFYMKSKNTV